MDSPDSPGDTGVARWHNLLPFVLIFVVALFARLFLILTGAFDGLYGQDAYAYYGFALDLRQALSHGQMPPPFFWSLGYPALLAAGTALFGSSALVGQTINVVMGAGCAALTFNVAQQIGCGRLSSVCAGMVVAFSGQALQSSIVLMSDIPALFWALLSASALLEFMRIKRQGATHAKGEQSNESPLHTSWRPRQLGVSITICLLTLTFAVLTRWLYLALVPPVLLALLMQRTLLRHMVIALVVISPVIALQVAHSTTSPYPTLDHPWVTGWSPQHYFQSSFDTPDGHAAYSLINAVFYTQPFFTTPYLTPLLTPFVLLGVVKILNRSDAEFTENYSRLFSALSAPLRLQSLAVPVLIIGWVLLPFLFLAGIPYQNIRFPLILLPPIALLCACGIEQVRSLFKRLEGFKWRPLRLGGLRNSNLNRQDAKDVRKNDKDISHFSILFASNLLNKLFTPLLLASLLLLARDGINYTQAFIARQMRDKAVVFWVRDHLPVDATLYTHGLSPALRHYTQMEIHELYDETPQSLSTAQHTGTYLLINGWQIINQWAGLAPGIAVNWLREHHTLRRIGRMNDYTLYLVVP